MRKLLRESQYYDPNFGGTETYYKHPMFKFNYTESVKYFCEEKEAYWVLDVVGSYMRKFMRYNFLILIFDVNDGEAVFYAQEDTGQSKIVRQEIPYTDLDVSVKFYLIDNVLMFPSDY